MKLHMMMLMTGGAMKVPFGFKVRVPSHNAFQYHSMTVPKTR